MKCWCIKKLGFWKKIILLALYKMRIWLVCFSVCFIICLSIKNKSFEWIFFRLWHCLAFRCSIFIKRPRKSQATKENAETEGERATEDPLQNLWRTVFWSPYWALDPVLCMWWMVPWIVHGLRICHRGSFYMWLLRWRVVILHELFFIYSSLNVLYLF